MILVCDVILCVCENVTSEDMTKSGALLQGAPQRRLGKGGQFGFQKKKNKKNN